MDHANIKVLRQLFEEFRDDNRFKTQSTYHRENCLDTETAEPEELHQRFDALPQETAGEIEQRFR